MPDAQRVAMLYGQADAVFVATLVEVIALPLPDDPVLPMPPGQTIPAEYATFRIDKVYKGARRAGSLYYTATSGFGASCGISVLDKSSWFPTPEKKRPLSRQWVIYSRGRGPYHIEGGGEATPLNRMVGNVRMLELLTKKAD